MQVPSEKCLVYQYSARSRLNAGDLGLPFQFTRSSSFHATYAVYDINTKSVAELMSQTRTPSLPAAVVNIALGPYNGSVS